GDPDFALRLAPPPAHRCRGSRGARRARMTFGMPPCRARGVMSMVALPIAGPHRRFAAPCILLPGHPMSRSAVALVFFLSMLLAWPSAALAQRSLAFESHAVPAQGTVAIAVAEGLPGDGSFARIDARSGGALRRAAELDGFSGKADSMLDLRGFAGYERLLVLGTGKQALSTTALQDIGGRVARATARSRAGRVDLVWDGTQADAASHLAFGASLSQYRFDKYRSRAGDGDDDSRAGTGSLVIRSHEGAA